MDAPLPGQVAVEETRKAEAAEPTTAAELPAGPELAAPELAALDPPAETLPMSGQVPPAPVPPKGPAPSTTGRQQPAAAVEALLPGSPAAVPEADDEDAEAFLREVEAEDARLGGPDQEEGATIIEVDDRPVRVPGPLSAPALDALAEKLGLGEREGAALGQMTSLNLERNQLTSLPAEIGQLVNLTRSNSKATS